MFGRGLDCDIIVDDALASRRQALVRWTGSVVELVCLGKNPTRVNDVIVKGTVRLQDGDQVDLPGTSFGVRIEPLETAASLWAVHTDSGGTHVLPSTGVFTVGGSERDQLVIPGLPAGLLHLSIEDGAPKCTNSTSLSYNGETLAAGTEQLLAPGDRLALATLRLTVRQLEADSSVETRTLPEIDLPTIVRLGFAHLGGALSVTFRGRSHELSLSERRADFVAVLLSPPRGYHPGSFIPDAALFPRVWGPLGGSRNSINVLINRVRKDLTAAGLPGSEIIERFSGGTATRFRLHPNASVEVA